MPENFRCGDCGHFFPTERRLGWPRAIRFLLALPVVVTRVVLSLPVGPKFQFVTDVCLDCADKYYLLVAAWFIVLAVTGLSIALP